MLHVQCPGCMTQAFLECTCPPGWLAAAGQHQPGCTHANPDANLACPPGSSCCQQDHDHAAAANACPGGHGDCPEPDKCPTWATAVADTRHPHYRGEPPGPCPGGHCHDQDHANQVWRDHHGRDYADPEE